jgi:hypothetical protein
MSQDILCKWGTYDVGLVQNKLPHPSQLCIDPPTPMMLICKSCGTVIHRGTVFDDGMVCPKGCLKGCTNDRWRQNKLPDPSMCAGPHSPMMLICNTCATVIHRGTWFDDSMVCPKGCLTKKDELDFTKIKLNE